MDVRKEMVTIDEWISTGVYAMMRRCAGAPQTLGHDSVWDMSVREFRWVTEMIGEEQKAVNGSRT